MKIGFIGCGNMATAMLKGILKSGEVAATDMIASAKSDKTRKKIEQELGIQKADTNAQVVDFAHVKGALHGRGVGAVESALKLIVEALPQPLGLIWAGKRQRTRHHVVVIHGAVI